MEVINSSGKRESIHIPDVTESNVLNLKCIFSICYQDKKSLSKMPKIFSINAHIFYMIEAILFLSYL